MPSPNHFLSVSERLDWIMLQLPRFDERDKYIQAIALGRVTLRGHETLDIFEGVTVVTLALDWQDVHEDCLKRFARRSPWRGHIRAGPIKIDSQSNRLRGLTRKCIYPRIEQGQTRFLKISDIAGNDCEPVMECRRSND
jgi:hypothetical protein